VKSELARVGSLLNRIDAAGQAELKGISMHPKRVVSGPLRVGIERGNFSFRLELQNPGFDGEQANFLQNVHAQGPPEMYKSPSGNC
jgi:hypothetical protein